jgi:hypothetical protein
MAVKHDHEKEAGRQGAHAMKRHHIVVATIAIVVAVALVLNYYLW